MAQLANSTRFINSYNKIDQALRTQDSLKRSLGYTDIIRNASRTNSIIQKYEEVLIDYGRLRNAIVHSANSDLVIAEPHIKIVENFERIARLVCTPPLALKSIASKVAKTIEYKTSLKEVAQYSYTSGYSNIPVSKNKNLIGVANSRKFAELIGKKLIEGESSDKYLISTTIEEAMKEYSEEIYYEIVPHTITIDAVLSLFSTNRKLLAILITKNGHLNEIPLGIITISDIMDINEILDNY